MIDAGELVIEATSLAKTGRLAAIEVRLSRPPVTRLFVGQPPEAVEKTVPYLFTLCAHAQRAAAQAALAAAAGQAPRVVEPADLWVEVLHEGFWRLLLDWPKSVGLPAAESAFIAWRGKRQSADFLAESKALFEQTIRPLATACLARLPTACLPPAGSQPGPVADAAARFAAPDWLAWWRGSATSAPPLHPPGSVADALLQRLNTLEEALTALADGAPFPLAYSGSDGYGIGQTLTARGILTHGARISDGRVAAYQVWAPTDRYFADAAPLAALLAERSWPDIGAARQGLEQAVLALDPCLPYRLNCHEEQEELPHA